VAEGVLTGARSMQASLGGEPMSDDRTTTGPHGRGTNGGWIGLRLPNGDPLPIWLEQGLVGATAILLVLGLTTAVLMGARTTTSTHRVQLAVTPFHDEHAQRGAARLGVVEAESVARAPEPTTPRVAPVPPSRPAAPVDHATPTAPAPPPSSNQPAATAPPTDPTSIAPAPDPEPAPPPPEPSPDPSGPPEVTPPDPPDEPPIDVIDEPPLPDDDPADDPADDPEGDDPGREDPGGGDLGPVVDDVVEAVVDLVTVPAL
jgi:hypothetical protein